MNIDLAQRFLLWSLALNYGVLLIWFAVFTLGHAFLFKLHGRWFRLSRETFDAIHYGSMAAYKLAILLLNLAPYLALRLVAA